MKNIKDKIKEKINALDDPDKLLELTRSLNIKVEDELEFIWGKIKPINQLNLSNKEISKLRDSYIQAFVTDTLGVKLYFDGAYYYNPFFNLKLRPEWVEVLK